MVLKEVCVFIGAVNAKAKQMEVDKHICPPPPLNSNGGERRHEMREGRIDQVLYMCRLRICVVHHVWDLV